MCTTKKSNFFAKCARRSGFGHEESTWSSNAPVLEMELPMLKEDLAVEAQAFVANKTGKCSVMIGNDIGVGELGKWIVQYIAGSAATFNMTQDADGPTNNWECSRPLSLGNRRTTSIAGYVDLTVAFRSDNGWAHVKLHDVAHAPESFSN